MAIIAKNAPTIRQGILSDPNTSASHATKAETKSNAAKSAETTVMASGIKNGRSTLIVLLLYIFCDIVIVKWVIALAAHLL